MKQLEQKKMIIRLAVPILCNYFITTSFEMMDQAIVGHYSTEAYAAVGVISKLMYVLTGSFGIFTSAFHITAAKCLAEQNDRAFQQTFRIAMCIVHMIGAVFLGGALIFGKIICQRVLGLTGDVLNIAVSYLYPAAITLWMNLVLFTFGAYYRNRLNTKISLWSTITSTGVNLFFDYSLVYGHFGLPELGGSGAAWGSVLGLGAGIVVYVYVYYRKDQSHNISGCKGEGSVIRNEMVKLYVPLLIQDLMECSVFTMVLSVMIARLSVAQMAAYQLLDVLGSMMVLPVFAFSSAGLTLSVQKKHEEVNSYTYIQSARGLALAAVMILGAGTMLFPTQICHAMVSDLTMNAEAARLLPLIVLIQLIRVVYELDKAYLQGNGDETYVCRTTIIISFVSLTYLAVLIKRYQVLGAYIGLLINHLIFFGCYRKRIIKE